MEAQRLKEIEGYLGAITHKLRHTYAATGELVEWPLDRKSDINKMLIESTESEREFILHKLAPELEVAYIRWENLTMVKLKLK